MAMRYELRFEDDKLAQDRFAMIYQGFNAGGQLRFAREPKPMTIARLEGKILDKLDAISDAAPPGTPNALIMRALKNGEGPQSITLEQPEIDLLRGHFEAAAGAWAPVVVREVVATADWLAALRPQEEPAA